MKHVHSKDVTDYVDQINKCEVCKNDFTKNEDGLKVKCYIRIDEDECVWVCENCINLHQCRDE